MIQPIPVLRNLGGCGGTVLGRLLAALPNVVLLSETNPRSANLHGGGLNALEQLKKWHPTLVDGELLEFDAAEIGHPRLFGAFLRRVLEGAERAGKRLVIRDYNFADLVGVPFVWPTPGDLSLDIALEGAPTLDVVLVRHPADQLASLRTHGSLRRTLTAEALVAGTLRLLELCPSAPVIRYEDLTADTPAVFRQVTEAFGLDYTPEALDTFTEVDAITGNLVRRNDPTVTQPPPSPFREDCLREMREVPGYSGLMERLGYSQP